MHLNADVGGGDVIFSPEEAELDCFISGGILKSLSWRRKNI